MKKITLLILFFACVSITYAQMWKAKVPSQVNSEERLNFYQIQKEFNKHWDKFDVKKGYYNVKGEKHKAAGWKQFKRWEWFWETRIDRTTGDLPNTNLFEIQQNYTKLHNTKADQANWENVGPNSSYGGYAGLGRINCIAFHPTNKDIFWVGTPSGGLWKTIDGGATWNVLTDDIPVLGVSDIVLANDYETSKTIYISTGDRDGQDNYSIGVLKSTDDGDTWNETGLTFGIVDGVNAIINKFLKNPNNSDILYVGYNGKIRKSIDGGVNWSPVADGKIYDIELKPNCEDTVIYAARYNYDNKKVEFIKSGDGGSIWNVTHTFSSDVYRVDLAVSEADSTVVYALACNNSGGLEGVYKSSDSGLSLSKVYDGDVSGNSLMGYYSDGSGENSGQGWYDITIVASPSDENILFLGGINTWKSTDGGVSWNINSMWTANSSYNFHDAPSVHADKHYLIYQDDTTLFEGNDGGIYKTSNGGTNWTDLTDGMIISQIYKLGISQTVQGEVITGLQDNGSKLVSSGVWEDVKGGDGMECIIDYNDNNIQYATYVNGQIDRTIDHWANWQTVVDITANMPDGEEENGAWVTPYVINPANNKALFLGYEDVWKTVNRGDSWIKISNLSLSNKIRSMAIAPADSNTLYITDFNNFYKTTDGGTNWSNLTSNLPTTSNSITYISVDFNDPMRLWITFGGFNNVKVYESNDGGDSWTNISAGLPEVPANTIVQNIKSKDLQLYVGTDLGVYFKEGTSDWVVFNKDLPSVIVTELEIYYDESTPENSILYAGTYGRGLWKSNVASFTVNTTSNVELLKEKNIEIFPNPTNGKFSIANNGTSYISELSIYDISGRKVYGEQLKNESREYIDLGEISKGVYILNLVVDNKNITSKILIK